MDKQNPAEVEDFSNGAGMASLFAAPVDSGRFIRGRLKYGFEDGDVFLEDDSGNCEISLQLLRALAEVLRKTGHILPFLYLVEELNEALF